MGCVVWLTGLSGAGKSTIAGELSRRIAGVEILDGDVIRQNLSKGLGYSKEDRNTNIRRIGFVAGLLAKHGVCVIVAAISPYREIRDELKQSIPGFVEVYCKASLETVKQRDPKGLYKRALAGEIQHFTGLDDPYEEPLTPDVLADTEAYTVTECAEQIICYLFAKRLV